MIWSFFMFWPNKPCSSVVNVIFVVFFNRKLQHKNESAYFYIPAETSILNNQILNALPKTRENNRLKLIVRQAVDLENNFSFPLVVFNISLNEKAAQYFEVSPTFGDYFLTTNAKPVDLASLLFRRLAISRVQY